MTIQLTSEQRAVVDSQTPGRPVRVEDSESGRVYWLVSSDDVHSLWTTHVSDAVEAGMQAIAQGQAVDWNPEAMKALARRTAAGGEAL
ncbi:hypothetical protein [Lacipirellula parvula]|uniref:Uncharacterized protein n=1 Tax=Lacipirellula parvula TaxID=2650471 RepID=A0A5K7X6I7_9BACT|nr:hypothetical protein [Lacipirellula parvula]BBO32148.1 hypothetical protein PLANPX_1760 [Lacipirellula parvula]